MVVPDHYDPIVVQPSLEKDVVEKLPQITSLQSRGVEMVPLRVALNLIDDFLELGPKSFVKLLRNRSILRGDITSVFRCAGMNNQLHASLSIGEATKLFP